MNSSSFFIMARAGAAGLVLALLGACATTEVSWRDSQSAALLAGKKTFRVSGPGGGGGFRGEAFGDNVNLAIISALTEDGYTPVTGDAADLSVAWTFVFTTASNPNYFATPAQQPGGPPPTLEMVGLNIYVSDGSGGKTLWRGNSPFPAPRNQWSPESSAALVKQTLHNFPPYREAAGPPPAAGGAPVEQASSATP